ncbi:MAG: hypothetical protein IIZ88_01665 [Prevotella sp.]|nr:hypothetical protein [Prevotella sp.]
MNRLTNILQTVLIVLVVTLLYRGCLSHGERTTADTLTVTRTEYHDTVIYQPVLTASTMTEKVVTVHYVTDTVRLPGDTITMDVPVEQKRYDDSLYTAYVSGYRPQLDSIRLHLPSTITETTITQRIAPPRLSIGIQTGAGYGIINHKPDIYLGIGAQWRLWPK